MNPDSKENNTTTIRKNRQLLMLLALVPEFQKEVKGLRERFQIPIDGYPYDTEEDKRRVDKKIGRGIQVADDAQLGIFYKPMFGFDEPSPKQFQQEIMRIGRKFKLPYNLYDSCTSGVAWIILCDRIAVYDKNWDIEHDFKYGDEVCRWVTLKAYAPLSKDESREAISALNKELKARLPQPISLDRRVHDEFEKLMPVFEEMLKRTGRPKKIKTYKTGSYLETLKKENKYNEKKMREFERKNPGDILEKETIRSWRKVVGNKTGRTKALLKRLNKLALDYFGHTLRNGDDNGN